MRRPISILVAAVVAVTGAAASFVPAQAAIPGAVPALLTDKGPAASVQEVRHNRRHSRRNYRQHRREARRHYRRHRDYGHYRHHRRHYGHSYYRSRPSVSFGFSVGVPSYGYGYAPSYGYGGGWQAACARKYRSFDWGSGTYLGYDGYRHRCVL